MTAATAGENFYSRVPAVRGFRTLMDPARYTPLPDDWMVGLADVVQSTKAIAEDRYKAVNMAGAAVVAAVTNALDGRDFPFVFGGDGASFAIAPEDAAAAGDALAATAAWTESEMELRLRVALVPATAIRAAGHDIRVARYAPSRNVTFAMFSGGGIAWADAAMKRGEFIVAPAPPGTWPDLSGLSCRFAHIKSARGLILALLVLPHRGVDPARFRALTEEIVALVEQSPDAGRPVPPSGPTVTWPSAGTELEIRARRGNRQLRRLKVLSWTLLSYLIMRSGIRIGRFEPALYLHQVVENSDFRKYDDGLRMVIDCTEELAAMLEARLKQAVGIAYYGLHRQQAAMMTCFTPSPVRADHVHFIDGAEGGYTAAAAALKAAARAASTVGNQG